MDDKKKELKLQVDIDENTAQGMYCNFAVVNHTDVEFVLDFIYLQPMQPKAKVRSRIITSPKHAKKLIEALSDNLRRYEEKFGPVPVDDGNNERQDQLVH